MDGWNTTWSTIPVKAGNTQAQILTGKLTFFEQRQQPSFDFIMTTETDWKNSRRSRKKVFTTFPYLKAAKKSFLAAVILSWMYVCMCIQMHPSQSVSPFISFSVHFIALEVAGWAKQLSPLSILLRHDDVIYISSALWSTKLCYASVCVHNICNKATTKIHISELDGVFKRRKLLLLLLPTFLKERIESRFSPDAADVLRRRKVR